jgi:hypothetical protein
MEKGIFETLGEKIHGESGAETGREWDGKFEVYKNITHGTGRIMGVLYPRNILPHQYGDAMILVEIIKKMFRISGGKLSFKEDPFEDIAQLALLKIIERKP